jgi:hypothetical protein
VGSATIADSTERFEIVDSQRQIEEHCGTGTAKHVVIARVPGFGLVARYETTSGGVKYQRFWEWLGDKFGRELGSSTDGHSLISNAKDRIGRTWGMPIPPKETQIRNFMNQWDHIAQILELEKHLPHPVFELGQLLTAAPNVATGNVEYAPFVYRHGGGDFGDFGQLEPDRVLAEAESWAPPLHGVAVENLIAIRQKRGCVRSKFVESSSPLRRLTIHVCTAFTVDTERVCKTLAWSTSD